ncbi:MAG: MBL fold metallo-hydrolase, partial [Chitinophagaceae bacterium]
MKSKSINPNLNLFPVAAGVWGMKDVFVNLYMILNPDDNSWVLVDTGLKWSAGKIRRMSELIFGEGARPSAILLTHGHFDHTGSVAALAEEWDIRVYAHHLELPYLMGVSSYPPADTTVGGGLFADLSFLYSRKPIDISKRVAALPADGTVPGLPDWRYLHTPGHTPGHVSLFREKDKVLISGDAVVTTKAESFWFTALQLKKISGPPKYLTSDWLSSAASVEVLAALEPDIIASGHGKPIRGNGMRKSLHNLADHFQKLAVPFHGRYIHQPALSDDSGVVHIPPRNTYDTSAPT